MKALQIITSNTVTISGIGANIVAPLSVNPGTTIIKNATPLSSTSTTVQDGDTIALRRKSLGFGLSTSANISGGSTSITWQITTKTPQIAYDSQGPCSAPQTASNVYFAVPIKPTTAFTAHYAGVGLSTGTLLMGIFLPSTISIFSNNAGVPGVALVNTTNFDTFFSSALTRLDGSSFSAYSSLQVSFGVTGVALSANTVYWLVIQYASVATPPNLIGSCGANGTGMNRKMSADGVTWVNWSGTSGNTHDGDPANLPGVFLAN